jgi:hypothetical protein
LSAIIGNQSHSSFQSAFRGVFSAILAVVGLAFLRRAGLSFGLWHIEQKLTGLLIPLSILNNNPLYWLHFHASSTFQIAANVVFVAAFGAHFRLVFLALFDSLRFKNRKVGSCFFFPKVLLAVSVFVVSVASGWLERIAGYSSGFKQGSGPFRYSLAIIQVLLSLVYLIWLGVAIVRARFLVHVTETYKFGIYSAALGTFAGVFGVVFLLNLLVAAVRESAVGFVLSHGMSNAFVLLMVYFHWPYEVLHDRDYPGAVSEVPLPNGQERRGTADGRVRSHLIGGDDLQL